MVRGRQAAVATTSRGRGMFPQARYVTVRASVKTWARAAGLGLRGLSPTRDTSVTREVTRRSSYKPQPHTVTASTTDRKRPTPPLLSPNFYVPHGPVTPLRFSAESSTLHSSSPHTITPHGRSAFGNAHFQKCTSIRTSVQNRPPCPCTRVPTKNEQGRAHLPTPSLAACNQPSIVALGVCPPSMTSC